MRYLQQPPPPPPTNQLIHCVLSHNIIENINNNNNNNAIISILLFSNGRVVCGVSRRSDLAQAAVIDPTGNDRRLADAAAYIRTRRIIIINIITFI